MRTITNIINLYKFDELTDEAKEKAIEEFRGDYDFLLCWQKENYDTVKAIADVMGWDYNVYSHDGISYYVSYDIRESDVQYLSGKRAMAYIQNNYIDTAKKPKTYYLNHIIYCDGRKNWKRKSKIKFEIDNCPFTGYYMDYCFSNAWDEWKKNFSKNSTVQDFVEMVADRISRDWTANNEYQISDEAIIETIQINDYEFTEDGILY